MKISFSIYRILEDQDVRDVLKTCDLVFQLAGHLDTQQQKAKEIVGDKLVELKTITSSRRIIRFLKYADVQRSEEAVELQTIFESLPKEVELTIYWIDCFNEERTPPLVITLPNVSHKVAL